MPVGLNQAVPRFVRGHLYKIYYTTRPEKYIIVRFQKQGYKEFTHYRNSPNKEGNHWAYVKRQTYLFTPVADNTNKPRRRSCSLLFTTIAKMNVEEIRKIDLSLYLDAKTIAPEFEKILKGKPLFIRRRKTQILPDPGKIYN